VTQLDLVVGPNGAGKSSFVAITLQPRLPGSVFVNADEIAKHRWPDESEARSYDAARVAAETRTRLIATGKPFIAETVFSHPSKLALIREAHAAGFTVHLHVLLIPEELAVLRVQERVRAGGHSVPEHKVRERYGRLWELVAHGVTLAETSLIYDNSRDQGPQIVARMSAGMVVGATNWPAWTADPLRQGWL
jgi:predicted ABC-type ATPase